MSNGSFSDQLSGFHAADTPADTVESNDVSTDSGELGGQTLDSDSVANRDLNSDVPVNSGYVEPEDTDETEFNLDRDGASDGERREVEREFMYVHHADPMRQADPNGIYLDDIQRQKAEIIRARVEGREPDLANPGATVGTPLMPVDVVMANTRAGVKPVVSETLAVSVGDYNRDEYGDVVDSEDGELEDNEKKSDSELAGSNL